jgi:DNA-binding transcriptional LysR family regulator
MVRRVPTHDPLLPGGELAAFAAAIETGTVHGAAEALNLTQSAATKRIQALERRVGAPLLERGRFGVAPTELGRLLYPEAKHVLSALAIAERVIADQASGTRPLRLAASQTIGEFVLPGRLAAFRAADGEHRVQLDVRNSPGVVAALRAGDVEVGFVEGTDELEDFDVLVLVRDEIVAVVAADHPWAGRRGVPATELPRQPFLTRERGSGTRSVAETALRRVGVELEPSLEVASTQSLKRAVLDGGFTLLSRLAVNAEVQRGTLAVAAVTGADLRRDLRAIRVHDRRLGAAAKAFWGFLEAGAPDG